MAARGLFIVKRLREFRGRTKQRNNRAQGWLGRGSWPRWGAGDGWGTDMHKNGWLFFCGGFWARARGLFGRFGGGDSWLFVVEVRVKVAGLGCAASEGGGESVQLGCVFFSFWLPGGKEKNCLNIVVVVVSV